MLRAVIFDLDDTLVDHTSAARTASITWGRGLTSDEFPFGKPDPGAFFGTCSRLDVAPCEASMVGVSLVADVEGALGAGLDAVLLDRRDDHPTHSPRTRSLDELEF